MQTIGVSPAANAADRLAVHRRVGLAEERAALGVADDHVLGAGLADHRRADLAGERALALPVADPAPRSPTLLLRAASAAACSAVNGGATHDLDVGDVLHQGAELFDVLHGLGDRLVHLPVAGDERSSHDLNQNANSNARTCMLCSCTSLCLRSAAAPRRQAASGRRGTPATRRRRSRCA